MVAWTLWEDKSRRLRTTHLTTPNIIVDNTAFHRFPNDALIDWYSREKSLRLLLRAWTTLAIYVQVGSSPKIPRCSARTCFDVWTGWNSNKIFQTSLLYFLERRNYTPQEYNSNCESTRFRICRCWFDSDSECRSRTPWARKGPSRRL